MNITQARQYIMKHQGKHRGYYLLDDSQVWAIYYKLLRQKELKKDKKYLTMTNKYDTLNT